MLPCRRLISYKWFLSNRRTKPKIIVLSLYITLDISVVSQKTLFILTYWKLYMETLSFGLPKCLLCSFSLKSELESYFQNDMKPKEFPSSSQFSWPITTDLVHSSSFSSQRQAVLPTNLIILEPGSGSAFKQGAQNWVFHGSRTKCKENRAKTPLHLLKSSTLFPLCSRAWSLY